MTDADLLILSAILLILFALGMFVASLSVLQSHARGRLAAMADPICQVEGDIWLDDPNTPGFSEMWAGQRVDVQVRDHPGLADGTYEMRLMEMGGDATPKVHLVFDPIIDPLEA